MRKVATCNYETFSTITLSWCPREKKNSARGEVLDVAQSAKKDSFRTFDDHTSVLFMATQNAALSLSLCVLLLFLLTFLISLFISIQHHFSLFFLCFSISLSFALSFSHPLYTRWMIRANIPLSRMLHFFLIRLQNISPSRIHPIVL